MTPRTFTFIKNIKGSLVVELETYDMMGVKKNFVFGPTVDRIIVPYPYALGLFVSAGAMDQYRLGLFTIENEGDLYKAGVEMGFVAREERPDITKLVDIEAAIKGNKVRTLKELIKKGESDVVVANSIISCARANFDTLNNEMVDLIQDATGVDLRIE